MIFRAALFWTAETLMNIYEPLGVCFGLFSRLFASVIEELMNFSKTSNCQILMNEVFADGPSCYNLNAEGFQIVFRCVYHVLIPKYRVH